MEKKHLSSKRFLVENIFGKKKVLEKKDFWEKHKKKVFGNQIFLGKNFWKKRFLKKKSFGNKILFGKMIYRKKILEKMIIGKKYFK